MKTLLATALLFMSLTQSFRASASEAERVTLNLAGLKAKFTDEKMSSFVIENDVNRFLPIETATITGPTLLFYENSALFFVRPDEGGFLQFTNCAALNDCREDILQQGELVNLRKLPRKLLQHDVKVDVLKMINHVCRGVSENASDLMFVIQTKELAIPGTLLIAVSEKLRVDNLFAAGRPVYEVENKVTGQIAQMHLGDDLRETYRMTKVKEGGCKTISGMDNFTMQIIFDGAPMTFSCEATWDDNYEVCPGF